MSVQFYNFLALLCVFAAVITAQTSTDGTTQPKLSWKNFKTAHKLKCKPGEYAVCKPCPRDQMTKKESVVGQCVDCTLYGKGTPKEGSSRCRGKCAPGEKYVDSSSTCEPCEAGTYMDIRGLNDTCKSCGPNMTSEAGARKCECMAGFQQVNGRCEACPEGRFKPEKGNSSCSKCPTNTTTLMDGAKDNKTECVLSCLPGQQYNQTTQVCDPCKPGFSKELGGRRTKCEPCPINTVAPKNGSRRCNVKCGKGYGLTADGCKNCTWNTYKSSPGNDACTPCPSGTHTWSKGAKSIHECISSARECVATAIEQIRKFYEEMEHITLGEDADIIAAVLATCNTPTAETFKKFSSSFMTCPELIQVQLPEVDIHGRKYTDADQKNVIKIIQEYLNYNSNGDYCAGEEGEDSGIWNGGETGGGSCEDHLKQILSELHMSATSDICSESYRLRQALSCFEEHAIEDKFNNLYRSQINNLIPSAAVVGLPEMTLRELIMYLDTSCVNNADCGAALEPLLYNLDASQICDQYPSLRSALSCFVDNGQEHMFTEEHRANIEPFIMSISPVGHTAGMSLNEMISILDTSCSSTGSCGDQLMPILTTLDMSNMCSQYHPLRSALSCFEENEMTKQTFKDQYQTLLNDYIPFMPVPMELYDIIAFLDSSCISTADCGAAIEPLLYNLDASKPCAQYLPLRSALSCFMENGQEHMFTEEHRAYIDPFIMSFSPVGWAGMPLNDIILILDTTCSSTGGGEDPQQSDCGAARETLLQNLDASQICVQSHQIQDTLNCYQTSNPAELMDVLDEIFYMIDITVQNLFPYLLDARGMITPKNMTHFLKVHCGSGECIDHDRILKEVTMTTVCDRYNDIKSALSCFTYPGGAEYFTEVYSADWSWIDAFTFDSGHLELDIIMNFLANYCWSGMPAK